MIVGTEPHQAVRSIDETTPLLSSNLTSSSSLSSGLGSTSSQVSSLGVNGQSSSSTLLPDLEEHQKTQMKPFGLSGISERAEEQQASDSTGQEIALPDSGVDVIGSGQDEIKPTTSQKGLFEIKKIDFSMIIFYFLKFFMDNKILQIFFSLLKMKKEIKLNFLKNQIK